MYNIVLYIFYKWYYRWPMAPSQNSTWNY